MTQALNSHPEQFTFEAYQFWQPPDDNRYELFRGQLIRMNPPTGLHTNISKFLAYALQRYFVQADLDLVANTSAGVRTEQMSSRIPDVTVCSRSLWVDICRRPGSGILDFTQDELPQLVIEVVSSNWQDDYLRKRAEYAIIRIPEYWIVDYQRQQIWVLTDPERLDGYDVVKHYPGETVESANFQGFSLTVDEILNPPFVEELMRQEQLRQDAMANRLRALGIDPDAC